MHPKNLTQGSVHSNQTRDNSNILESQYNLSGPNG